MIYVFGDSFSKINLEYTRIYDTFVKTIKEDEKPR